MNISNPTVQSLGFQQQIQYFESFFYQRKPLHVSVQADREAKDMQLKSVNLATK